MGELVIRQASSRSDFDACVALQRDVWGLPDLEVSSAPQLIASTTLAGGLLQSITFLTGIKALLLIVAALYLAAVLLRPKSNRVPQPSPGL